MAKCIKLKDKTVKRVSNSDAQEYVKEGAVYISKSDWKKERGN